MAGIRLSKVLVSLISTCIFTMPMVVGAVTTTYVADLQPLNNSGVTGTATAILMDTNTLTLNIHATGLEPNQIHPQHIHGVLGGVSTIPTLACCDTDHDGFIEVLEGAKAYGPVLLNATNTPGPNHEAGFPTAPNGVIDFSHTYNLNDPITFAGVAPPLGAPNPNKDLLFPLENRHVVIHGMSIHANPDGTIPGAGTSGEVDGTIGYKAVLPVANGTFHLVPEPSSIGLFSTGLLGLGWSMRQRCRRPDQ